MQKILEECFKSDYIIFKKNVVLTYKLFELQIGGRNIRHVKNINKRLQQYRQMKVIGVANSYM